MIQRSIAFLAVLYLTLVFASGPAISQVPAMGDPSSSSAATDSGASDAPDGDNASATKSSGYHEAYRIIDELNVGLPAMELSHELVSPQSTVELLMTSIEQGDADRAAHALNLNGLASDLRAIQGPWLADQLYYLLDREVGIDWESLSDRPDGYNDFMSSGAASGSQSPRRSLHIGTMKLDGRDVVLRLQRVKAGGAAPVWLFSPQTVRHIPGLYGEYGPTFVDQMMPPWARQQILGMTPVWAWLGFLVVMALGVFLALPLRSWLKRRLKSSDEEWVVGLGKKIASPIAALAGATLVYTLCVSLLEMPGAVNHLILVALVLAITWLAMRAIAYFTEHIITKRVDDISDLATDDHNQYQQWLTYLSVGRRLLILILFLIAAGVIVSQFRSLQALGVSMIASAGVASVILGIAAQPMLANVVAGAQIAITRPVRIGDSVLYEGSWGYVEDITYTYVLIQTWDQRRLIVPLRYFISKPFENWTLQSAHLTKPIYFHAHYTVDIDAFRDKFEQLLRDSEDWDEERDPEVIVTNAGDETIELRAVCSCKDASTAWSLHCYLREEMIKFLRDMDGGRHLPKRRLEVAGPADADDGQAGLDSAVGGASEQQASDHPGGQAEQADEGDGDSE